MNRTKRNIYHANINVNLIIDNVNQIISGIMINVVARVKIQKNIVCEKKVIFGILLHIVAKVISINKNY